MHWVSSDIRGYVQRRNNSSLHRGSSNMAGQSVPDLQIVDYITKAGKRSQFVMFEGVKYTRCLDSKYRTHREYFTCSVSGFSNSLHRAVYERFVGEIPDGFDVHHRDGNSSNNMPDNLQAISSPDHTKLHAESLPIRACICPACGVEFKTRAIKPGLCSSRCRKSHRTQNRSCVICGAGFTIHGFEKAKTCSRECNYKLRSLRRVEMHKAKRAEGKYPECKPCCICGEMSSTPKTKTCSRECAIRNRSERATAQHQRARLQSSH